MAKLTYEDKKEIIRLYDIEHLGYESISKKIKISPKVIERIVRKYHIHGENVLMRKSKRQFSADFKLEVIRRTLSGEYKASVSIEYDIEPSQIRQWIKKYEENGYNGLINKLKGRNPAIKKEKKDTVPGDKDAIDASIKNG